MLQFLMEFSWIKRVTFKNEEFTTRGHCSIPLKTVHNLFMITKYYSLNFCLHVVVHIRRCDSILLTADYVPEMEEKKEEWGEVPSKYRYTEEVKHNGFLVISMQGVAVLSQIFYQKAAFSLFGLPNSP